MRGEMTQHRAHPPHEAGGALQPPGARRPCGREGEGRGGGRWIPRPSARLRGSAEPPAGRCCGESGPRRWGVPGCSLQPFSAGAGPVFASGPAKFRGGFLWAHHNARRDVAACFESLALLRFTPSSRFSVHMKTLPSTYSLMSGDKSSKLCKLSTTKVIIVIEFPKI